jgi:hypothetical protein
MGALSVGFWTPTRTQLGHRLLLPHREVRRFADPRGVKGSRWATGRGQGASLQTTWLMFRRIDSAHEIASA